METMAAERESRTDRSGSGEAGSVVFVSQQYPPDKSGHASRIRDTATTLADDGWSVTVLAPPPSFPPEAFRRSWTPYQRQTREGVCVRRLWSWQPTGSNPGFLSRMLYYVIFAVHALCWLAYNAREFDVVVTTTPPISTGLAGIPTALFGGHWVVDVRDSWIDASVSLGFITPGGVLERLSRRFQGRVLQTADRIAVTTETLGDELASQYGSGLTAKMLHVPNGVDTSRFQARPDGGSNASDASSGQELTTETTDQDRPVVIYTGNIGHAQNLESCLRALPEMETDAVLRLVGGGDAVPALRRLANDLGVSDRVEFVGSLPHEEIPRHLQAADVGIAPLKADPELSYAMPTKVYEYLGSELPVVATGRGELRRFLEQSGGGVCTDGDPSSIARELDAMLTDPERRRVAGRRGYEYVEETYDRDRIAREFSAELRALCQSETPAE
jgi:colanic acid biosynthesis glycosyl transferase WcaI